MKKDFRIVIGIFVLVILLGLLSYFFFTIFKEKNPSIISKLEVSFSDVDRAVINKDFTLSKEKIKPYAFSVINKEKIDTKYKVILVDHSKGENSIAREDLKYELILNGTVINTGRLSKIRDNVLDVRTISKNSTNHYKVKIWLDSNRHFENVTYTYSVKVVS